MLRPLVLLAIIVALAVGVATQPAQAQESDDPWPEGMLKFDYRYRTPSPRGKFTAQQVDAQLNEMGLINFRGWWYTNQFYQRLKPLMQTHGGKQHHEAKVIQEGVI